MKSSPSRAERKKDHDQEVVFRLTERFDQRPGAIHGNRNVLIVNGLNGATNGVCEEGQGSEGTEGGETLLLWRTMVAVQREGRRRICPRYRVQAHSDRDGQYMQRIMKRRDGEALIFDQGLLEYK